MPIVTTNFILGRMNKSVDERLLPPGEYIDALNIRLGSTEATEIGAVENSKGNTKLTTLRYNNSDLSSSTVCIGAYEDGVRETIYWLIHDKNNPVSASGIVDMVVSYNTTNQLINYHVVSETILNFDPKYLVTGIDLIDGLLFWTDDINPPRYLNVKRNYPLPIANVDQIVEEDINVIVKIPGFEKVVNSNIPLPVPKIELINIPGEENYIENRFLCFAYRYKYEDGQYSATSLFSLPAFVPKPFEFDTKNYNNAGMQNLYNGVNIEFSTGSKRVKEVDLLFKDTASNSINIIERFIKEDYGWANNSIQSYTFTNSKIYTLLGADELLRQYDNVPRFAKAQIVQGNRLMYGNYIDGYNITRPDADGSKVSIDYNTSLITTPILFDELPQGIVGSGIDYNIDPASTLQYINSKITFDLSITNGKLKKDAYLGFSLNCEHQTTEVGAGQSTNPAWVQNDDFANPQFVLQVNITLDADYNSTWDFIQSPLFQDAIGTVLNLNFQPMATANLGNSLTDFFNNELSSPVTGYSFSKNLSSINSATSQQGFLITDAAPGSDVFSLQILAMKYQNIDNSVTTDIYEYFRFISGDGGFTASTNKGSLHSNRDFETGIVYSDNYGRSSTVLVSERNTVFVEPGNSDKRNTIQVQVNSRAPYWADRYKFVVKPSLGNYETIYSNFYYTRPSDNMIYFKLEGDNANKVAVGQTLIVKADVNGPLTRLETVEVLAIEPEPTDFLATLAELGTESSQLKGLYMQVKNQNFNIEIPADSVIEYGRMTRKSRRFGCSTHRTAAYPCFIQDVPGDGTGGTTNYDIPGGSIIKVLVTSFRNDTFNGQQCQQILWEWEQTYVASSDFADMRRWWIGDNINPELAQPGDIDDETTIKYNSALVDPAFPPPDEILNTIGIGDDVECTNWEVTFQWIQAAAGLLTDPLYLGVSSGIHGCYRPTQPDRTADIRVELIVQRANTLIVFETEPIDANPELFFDASESFKVTQPEGFHLSGEDIDGGDQHQTASLDAIVNLNFQDCYAFGNGIESFKIKDALEGRPMVLGQRVLAVSNEDYKEADRFEGITYSGVYSSNNGINNLNEFNLGLVNFKDCETSFGPIQKMHARQTDILVLQEDRITYVLASKNLISDSTGGGAIVSVPEVLGTQIARIEEYGISYNPESFVAWGSDMFFTDVKRGAVLKLRGTSMNNDSLEVISSLGMRSWFRDEFFESIQTQKLGGYDPYMNEYVLGMNCISIPLPPDIAACGYTLQRENLFDTPIITTVNYGAVIGQCDIDYNITVGSITISVLWNGITTTSSTLTGNGTFSFDKTLNSPSNAVITITAVTNASFTITANCPNEIEITVIKVVINSAIDSGKFIHAEYNWNDTSNISPIDSDLMELGSDSLIASEYQAQTGIRSLGVFPYDGVDLTIRSNKIGFDNYNWGYPSDNFKYLSSNTLYINNETDIASLLSASTTIANSNVTNPSDGLYQTTVAGLNLPIGNQYLYLIYDYKFTSCQEFCYDAVSASAACCDCAFTYTGYSSSTIQQNAHVVCGQPLSVTYYHTGTNSLPVVADFVYSSIDGAVGTTLPIGLYKSSQTTYITINQFGLVTAVTNCP
tara:strand:- start:361 stop:5151 length:4791 start_codon:yes stop_codon:yes gene_type:complete